MDDRVGTVHSVRDQARVAGVADQGAAGPDVGRFEDEGGRGDAAVGEEVEDGGADQAGGPGDEDVSRHDLKLTRNIAYHRPPGFGRAGGGSG